MKLEWPARRILKELCDAPKRQQVLSAFWKKGDDMTRRVAVSQLAKSLHFREETLRKAPVEKKADLLATRLAAPEFEDCFEAALMLHHTSNARELLAAFLDEWQIPHQEGTIEAEEYKTPTEAEVRASVEKLRDRFPARDIALYLASAGLLMGHDWAHATWPVVDDLVATEASSKG